MKKTLIHIVALFFIFASCSKEEKEIHQLPEEYKGFYELEGAISNIPIDANNDGEANSDIFTQLLKSARENFFFQQGTFSEIGTNYENYLRIFIPSNNVEFCNIETLNWDSRTYFVRQFLATPFSHEIGKQGYVLFTSKFDVINKSNLFKDVDVESIYLCDGTMTCDIIVSFYDHKTKKLQKIKLNCTWRRVSDNLDEALQIVKEEIKNNKFKR